MQNCYIDYSVGSYKRYARPEERVRERLEGCGSYVVIDVKITGLLRYGSRRPYGLLTTNGA